MRKYYISKESFAEDKCLIWLITNNKHMNPDLADKQLKKVGGRPTNYPST